MTFKEVKKIDMFISAIRLIFCVLSILFNGCDEPSAASRDPF